MSRISAITLRDDADNLAHGNRDIYPVGQLLDAAETIDALHNDLAAGNTRLARQSAVIEAVDEALNNIVECYEARSELYTSDADMADIFHIKARNARDDARAAKAAMEGEDG